MADVSTLVFDIDSSQARGAAKALAEMNSAVINAANGLSKFERTLRDSGGRFQSTAKYLQDNRVEVERLAMAYNPVLAAQIKYRDETVKTAAAVKAGVITEEQRIDLLQRMKAAMDTASGASASFGKTQEVAKHHVANLSFQLNDIGMMMASGQNPFMLMIQQGPQVAQIFSQMNAEGRKIGPTLVGAFRMILNPTTLVTLAVIAGTAALTQWATGAGSASKAAKKLSDGIDDLQSKTDALGSGSFKFNIETGKLEANLDSILGKYGSMNEEVRRHITLLQEANAAAASYSTLNFLAGFEESFADKLGYLTTRVDEVRIAFGTTNDTARDLIRLMKSVGEQRGITAQKEAAIELRDRLLTVTGGIQNMTAEQVKYFVEVSRAVDQLIIAETQLERNTSQAVDAATATARWAWETSVVVGHLQNAASLLSSIGGGAINRASRAAQQMVLDAGGSTMEVAAAGKRAEAIGRLQQALQGKQITIEEYARLRKSVDEEAAAWASLNAQIEVRAKAERDANKKDNKKGGSAAERKAAAELKAAEKGFQSLRELLEKESLFQFAEYEKRQAQLDTALKKQLLTRQQYDEYQKQLRINYFGTEFQQRQLQYDLEHQQLVEALERGRITREEYAAIERQIQWRQVSELGQIRDTGVAYDLDRLAEGFGQAAAMAGDYNSSFLRAQRVFAASAALISTYQGAAKALELPFPQNIAAAAKVLAAGMGFVSAIKGGGKGGGGGSSAPSTTPKQEPTKNILVRLEGPDWMQDMADDILTQIYDQSKDGRVIISRDM